jgi:peptidoglycan hydrolase FlgJ
MADLAPSPSLLQPLAQSPSAAAGRSEAQARRAAEEFEAVFLSQVLGTMFQGTTPEAPFSGGPGEDTFRSFLTDAMARSLAKGGGVGLAGSITRELIKLQESPDA